MYLRKRALSLAIALAASPVLADTSAEEPIVLAELAPVTVTATRDSKTEKEATRSVATVSPESIESRQASSAPELVKDIPNVTTVGGPRSENQRINIRGLEGARVLQLVDGARQVFESGHRPSYFIEPELIRSAEVIRGPASNLWGSGAVGGVASFNTVDPTDLIQPDASVGGFLKGTYNDNNNDKRGSAAVAGTTKHVDWLVSGYNRESDDMEVSHDQDLANSASREDGGMGKLVWHLADNQNIAFTARQADFSGGVPSNGSAPANGTSNFLIQRDQTTRNAAIDYRHLGNGDGTNSQAMFYWNGVEMDETRESDGRPDSTQLDLYGINLNHTAMLGKLELLMGVDGYQEQFSAERGGSNRPTPPDATTDVWGVFAQGTYPLTGTLDLELGVRYDDFATKADNLSEDRSDSAVSPSAALSWQAAEWARVTLRHDQAFRAPSSEELYSTGTHFCMGPGFCNTFVSNPDLDPEQAANNELLVRMDWSELAGGDSLTVKAAIFQNKVDNFIEQIVTPPVFFPPPAMDPGNTYWVNVDKATLEGFELEAEYRLEALGVRLGYGQTRGEDEDTGEDLTNIPADTLNADLFYGFWDSQFTAGVRMIHAREQDLTDYATNTGNTTYDGYTVTDLYASWTPKAWPAIRADVTVNNITDRSYRVAWSELDSPGRAIISSLRYQF